MMPETSPPYRHLPEMLQYILNNYRNSAALNYKYLGQWEEVSTEKLVETVRRLALGLHDLGLKPGDSFAIMANPSPLWVIMDLAIMVNRAVSIPIFPNLSPDVFDYQVADSGARFLFLADEDRLDPAIRARLGRFQRVVAYSVRTRGSNVVNYREALTLGDALSRREPHLYYQLQERVTPTDLCTIIYTSGSTGRPRGVELTHENLVSQIRSAAFRFPLDPARDRVLSYLPLAHVFERMCMYYYMSSGTSVFFANEMLELPSLMREVQPTAMATVPRVLEKFRLRMREAIASEPAPWRKLAEFAMRRADSREPGPSDLTHRMLERMVYSRMREALGGRLRLCIVGGSALPTSVGRFFRNIGVPIFEGYGLTECSPVVTANYPGSSRLGTVGKPFPDTEVQIAKDGEVLVRGPGVMRGYHNQPRNQSPVDSEGWLHTGDKGILDADGFLVLTGRIKEMFKTSGGKYVSPLPIEDALRQCDWIDTPVVVAENRPYPVCLIFPDWDKLEELRKLRGSGDLSLREFASSETVFQEIDKHVQWVNRSLNQWERVRAFHIVADSLSPETGELTPTYKLKRGVVEKRFATLISQMYREESKASGPTGRPADPSRYHGLEPAKKEAS